MSPPPSAPRQQFLDPEAWTIPSLFKPFSRQAGGLLAVLALGVLGFVLLNFLAPQAPIRIRYIGLVAVVSIPLLFPLVRDRFAQIFTGYTVYIVVMGLYYTLAKGDGLVADALFPIKSLLVVLLVLAAGRYFRPSAFLLFAIVWIVVQSAVVVLERKVGPIWQRLPFPIFGEDHLQFIAARDLGQDRSGGLTFEPSVLGGMMAMMVVFLSCNVMGALDTLSSARPRRLLVALCAAVALMGFAATFLIKTKSGLFVFGVSAIFAAVLLVLGRQSLGLKVGVVTGLGLLTLAGSGAFVLAMQSSYGDYVEQEQNRLIQSLKFGHSSQAESGFDTRLSYAQIGVYGLLYHPLGVGYSSGYSYAQPLLDDVVITREMEQMFAMESYRGYKGEVYENLMMAGVVAIAVLTWLIVITRKVARGCRGRVVRVTADVFCFALVVTGLIIELWPFWESLALYYAWITSVRREGWDVAAANSQGADSMAAPPGLARA